MNNKLLCLAMGMVLGIYIGYSKEDEIHMMCYKGQRTKKKLMRKAHQFEDEINDHLCYK